MQRMHVSKQLGRTVSVLGLLAIGAGCGDGDGGGAPKSSGVTTSKPASEITDAEAVKICEWVNAQAATLDPSQKQACTYIAVQITQTEADCDAYVKQCLEAAEQQPTPEGEDDGDDCTNATASDASDCTATIGEVESCYRDAIAAQQDALESASCANAGKANPEPSAPASCTKLQTTCPDLLGDDDGGGMSGGEDVSGNGGSSDGSNGFEEPAEMTCDGGTTTYTDFDVCDDIPDCSDGADEAGC